MSSEELCAGCPIREVEASPAPVFVNPDIQEDRALIAAQPNGEAISDALALPHPDRCNELAEQLPIPPRAIKNGTRFRRCPEVGLLALLYSDVDDLADVTG